jgi:hypothetical protein
MTEAGTMAIQASIFENEQDQALLRELQHAVLSYLAENGSAKWGALYIRFYHEKADEIGPALQHLAQGKHIAVEMDGATKITPLGMGQLKNRT